MQLATRLATDDPATDDIGRTTLTTLLRHSMFWTPEREAPSDWSEHVPFAFWLVDVLRPRRIVELGTRHGVSYSAMCQAVKTLGLSASCFAVDSWSGDGHPSFCGEDVYHDFKAFHDPRYGAFSQLLRSRFDDALEHFEPGSIDLLHIDGLNTYEAARHDYQSWLPKLSASAIILIPGIADRDGGVFRLWTELTANKPHFEFVHGHGLGVLGGGRNYPTTLTLLFHATTDQRRLHDLRQTFMTVGRAASALSENDRLKAAVSKHTATIAQLQDAVSKRDGDIDTLNDALLKSTDKISSLGDAHAKNVRLNRIVSELRASRSWRITAPLRGAVTAVRTLMRGGQSDRIGEAAPDYDAWILKNDHLSDDDRVAIRNHIASFSKTTKLSILMPVHTTSPQHLQEAIDSVVGQLYPDWELCIAADESTLPQLREFFRSYESRDRRIKVRLRDADGGIAACTNAALAMASGAWIVLMNPNDVLAEHALYLIADAVNHKPGAGIIYSDEDKIDAVGRRSDPYFKPDWDYDLFLGQNLINHLGAYRADLARSIGGFREGLEGSQDWDFALRILEAGVDASVHHVPFILYHARRTARPSSSASLAQAADSARLAVTEHMERTAQPAEVTNLGRTGFLTIRRRVPAVPPRVSIVIPTKNRRGLLKTCTDGLLHRTGYSPVEIVIVDNGSTEPDACDLLADLGSRQSVVIVRDDGPFNFSRLVNRGVAASSGDISLLLNNDVDVINPDWLDELVAHASRPDIGAVGAKLYYPDDTLQHGGVILGIGGIAAHVHKATPRESSGYYGRLRLVHTLSCVTGACVAVRRVVYDEVGGFDEKNLAVAFNDVDFCIRVRQAGYRIIWTPNAELYHHESISRGQDIAPEKAARFVTEVQYMRSRWASFLDSDPYYNPNCFLGSEFFETADRSRVQKPWLTGSRPTADTVSWSRRIFEDFRFATTGATRG